MFYPRSVNGATQLRPSSQPFSLTGPTYENLIPHTIRHRCPSSTRLFYGTENLSRDKERMHQADVFSNSSICKKWKEGSSTMNCTGRLKVSSRNETLAYGGLNRPCIHLHWPQVFVHYKKSSYFMSHLVH